MQEGQSEQPNPDSSTTNWQFNADTQPAPTTPPPAPSQLDWTASEFIAHAKGAGWYMTLIGVTLLITAVVYLLTKDVISASVVIIVSVLFGFLAARKPREVRYMVDNAGIYMGEKLYPYSQFKSFSLVQEEAAESVWLMPLKRFMPIIAIYFDPADEAKIAEALSNFLPFENRQPDMVDKLMHRLRF